MSKKYVVKNCPSFIDFDEQSLFENLCKNGGNCQDCTDCVMKQVIELCKEQTQFCGDCSTLTCEDCNFSTNGFAEEVIELLDIQEVE